MSTLLLLSLTSCILDRTGQSATESIRREVAMHGARLGNVETTLDDAERRVAQLEEFVRDRGQQEILKMETMEELRGEVARLRGDLELMRHETTTVGKTTEEQLADAQFRVAWLESRAAQLEEALGLTMPAPPERPEETDDTGAPDATDDTGDTEGDDTGPEAADADEDKSVTDPDELMALAEKHLAAGREKAAEAVLARFIDRHPDHKRLPEAKYRFAEAAFNAKDYKGAVLRFQHVIDDHKSSGWAPWAMLRQGECFEVQGQKQNARLFYEDVMRLWPKSKAAKEAKSKL